MWGGGALHTPQGPTLSGGHDSMKEIRLMDNAEFIEILLRYRGLTN